MNKKDFSFQAIPLYLTKKQIAYLLNMSVRNASKILAEHGVQPIDLGRGRGNGLRWLTEAVIKVADILHTEAQGQKNRVLPKTPKKHSVLGKSADDLWAEFNGSTHSRGV